MQKVAVKKIYNDLKEKVHLALIEGEDGLDREVTETQVYRPGLALAGFTAYFPHKCIQILGGTEITYLESLSSKKRNETLRHLLSFDTPAYIIARDLQVPQQFLRLAKERKIPVMRTILPTNTLILNLNNYLWKVLSAQVTVHGTLVDVYGIGMLFTGDSGVGKSECALDLVERGHRLVADDVVNIIKSPEGILIGKGSELLGFHMEVRGVGVINVESLFGVRAIRMHKRVEVEVCLRRWEDIIKVDRTGLELQTSRYLDVEIPQIIIPIQPGKNITVIVEVIAMNFMLKVYGHDPAQEFAQKLLKSIQEKKTIDFYVRGDLE